jgi:hypothetical protein
LKVVDPNGPSCKARYVNFALVSLDEAMTSSTEPGFNGIDLKEEISTVVLPFMNELFVLHRFADTLGLWLPFCLT